MYLTVTVATSVYNVAHTCIHVQHAPRLICHEDESGYKWKNCTYLSVVYYSPVAVEPHLFSVVLADATMSMFPSVTATIIVQYVLLYSRNFQRVWNFCGSCMYL